MRMVYCALVQSVFTYGTSAWGGAYHTNIKMLKTTKQYTLKDCLKMDRFTQIPILIVIHIIY